MRGGEFVSQRCRKVHRYIVRDGQLGLRVGVGSRRAHAALPAVNRHVRVRVLLLLRQRIRLSTP